MYVDTMENIYPAYLDKITRTEKMAREKPAEFAEKLNEEYAKHRKSKSKKFTNLHKLPVRIYGSGDYIKEHYEFLKKVTFKFYIISKSLTRPEFREELEKVLNLPNLTSVVLSFDTQNIKNYNALKHLFKQDKIKFSFTGIADDYIIERDFNDRKFDIFFNIGQKKIDAEASQAIRESCPTDAKKLELHNACTVCNKCWRSSKTKGSWNIEP
jgi:hypothetical protein